MKKKISYSLIPLIGIALAIFGIAALKQNQKQNQNIEIKIDRLAKKMDQLGDEVRISHNSQVAGAATENTDADSTKKVTAVKSQNPSITWPKSQPASGQPISTPTTTPSPTPTPTPQPKKLVTVAIQDLSSFKVELQENDTAFSVLLRAGKENNFTVEYETYEGLGAFVKCIGGICGHDNFYWAFYYNGQYSMTGASGQPVKENDVTAWQYETW